MLYLLINDNVVISSNIILREFFNFFEKNLAKHSGQSLQNSLVIISTPLK